MNAVQPLRIAREAAIGFAINATLSLAFFLGIFGVVARSLTWGAPDALGLDFVPQSIAVALMSALVPSLIARKRLGLVISIRAIMLRAMPPVGWGEALAIKLLYGGALGALITTLALKRMIR
jgi:hypothetical protein